MCRNGLYKPSLHSYVDADICNLSLMVKLQKETSPKTLFIFFLKKVLKEVKYTTAKLTELPILIENDTRA